VSFRRRLNLKRRDCGNVARHRLSGPTGASMRRIPAQSWSCGICGSQTGEHWRVVDKHQALGFGTPSLASDPEHREELVVRFSRNWRSSRKLKFLPRFGVRRCPLGDKANRGHPRHGGIAGIVMHGRHSMHGGIGRRAAHGRHARQPVSVPAYQILGVHSRSQ
jgi:hypothetical protein